MDARDAGNGRTSMSILIKGVKMPKEEA